MPEKTILFISNGYGEDTIACTIIERLKKIVSPERIKAFPLVGEGDVYKLHGVNVVAPTKTMPSGGLFPEGYAKNFWTDVKAGLASLTMQQVSKLGALKPELQAVVAVGDTFPVVMGGMFTGHKVIFIGTAKSDYFEPYSKLEMSVFKKFAIKAFPRDKITADSLRKSAVNAEWVGNAMMDSLDITGERFGIPEDRKVIALLFGSRDFAYKDLPVLLDAVDAVQSEFKEPLGFVSPLANSINLDDLAKAAVPVGYTLQTTGKSKGMVGKLVKRMNTSGAAFESTEVILVREMFGDTINIAHLAIGQAGTGNEQAAGLGKPVIGFDSGGKEKVGWYRARQKGLLGDALAVTQRNAQAVAQKAMEILNNGEIYKHMAEVGKERMGPSGGAKKMADFIANVAGAGIQS